MWQHCPHGDGGSSDFSHLTAHSKGFEGRQGEEGGWQQVTPLELEDGTLPLLFTSQHSYQGLIFRVHPSFPAVSLVLELFAANPGWIFWILLVSDE